MNSNETRIDLMSNLILESGNINTEKQKIIFVYRQLKIKKI